MNRRERREQFLALEQHILAGERKADIVGQAAVDGSDWQALAREVARIPLPANRHRWRWLNRLLLAALVAAGGGQLVAVRLVEGGSFWLAMQVLLTVYFVLALVPVARYRLRGYGLASTAGIVALGWWLYVVAWGKEFPASGGLVAAEAALCTVALALAMLTQRLLLPATTFWTEARPKLDADGKLVFEE